MARGLTVTDDSILACYTTSLYWSIMTVLEPAPCDPASALRWPWLSGCCHSTSKKSLLFAGIDDRLWRCYASELGRADLCGESWDCMCIAKQTARLYCSTDTVPRCPRAPLLSSTSQYTHAHARAQGGRGKEGEEATGRGEQIHTLSRGITCAARAVQGIGRQSAVYHLATGRGVLTYHHKSAMGLRKM